MSGREATVAAKAALVTELARLARQDGAERLPEELGRDVQPGDLQEAVTLLLRTYVQLRAEGRLLQPVRSDITATDAVVVCHGLLDAADLEVFELACGGLWADTDRRGPRNGEET